MPPHIQNLDLDARVADQSSDQCPQATRSVAIGTTRTFKETIVDAIKAYYTPTALERKNDAQVYRYVGAHIFRKFLPTGGDYAQRFFGNAMRGWSIKDSIKQFKDKKKGLEAYIDSTCVVETSHVIAGAALAAITLSLYAVNHNKTSLAIMTSINIIGNLYPSLVQRYNRARLTNTLEKLESRTPSQASPASY
ncbi:TPA: hypothetical protein HA251_05915 [Candidatus Woesearchaeota archaeon]|nr:hypothetical protein [Candidatus Woesearchaeota archaeon]